MRQDETVRVNERRREATREQETSGDEWGVMVSRGELRRVEESRGGYRRVE
jgi:hypothetical protein